MIWTFPLLASIYSNESTQFTLTPQICYSQLLSIRFDSFVIHMTEKFNNSPLATNIIIASYSQDFV